MKDVIALANAHLQSVAEERFACYVCILLPILYDVRVYHLGALQFST